MVARDDPRTQVLQSVTVLWELQGLNNPDGLKAKTPEELYLEPKTTIFLIPTFVNGNHWMLCVARIPAIVTDGGQLELFNSLKTTYWNLTCRKATENVVRTRPK